MVSKLLIVLAATLDEMLIFCKMFNAGQLVKMVNCSQVYMYSLSFVQANTIAAISRLYMLYLVWESINPVEPHENIFTFLSVEIWMNTYPAPFFNASVKIIEFAAGSNGSSGMLSDIALFTSLKHYWRSNVHLNITFFLPRSLMSLSFTLNSGTHFLNVDTNPSNDWISLLDSRR